MVVSFVAGLSVLLCCYLVCGNKKSQLPEDDELELGGCVEANGKSRAVRMIAFPQLAATLSYSVRYDSKSAPHGIRYPVSLKQASKKCRCERRLVRLRPDYNLRKASRVPIGWRCVACTAEESCASSRERHRGVSDGT